MSVLAIVLSVSFVGVTGFYAVFADKTQTPVRLSYGVISPLVDRHDPIILRSRGTVTMGPDLESALIKMAVLEQLMEIVFIADQLGRVDGLSNRQVRALQDPLSGKRKRN